jgi:hypothetical protein
MAIRLSCPSCNSSFTLADLPIDRRAACPRCADVFSIRRWQEIAPGEVSPFPPMSDTGERSHRGMWSVRRSMILALSMGLAGLLSGFGAYYYWGDFRAHPAEPDLPTTIAATPPTQLVGLGYLPFDTTIAFAFQPGPFLAFAEREHQDPRELFIRAGLPGMAYDTVTNLGLNFRNIDHIVAGTSVGELRLALVLILRRPIEAEADFIGKLKAKKTASGPDRYRVELAWVELTMVRVAPAIWVFGLDAGKDLEAVKRGGYGVGGKQFALPLAEAISIRVPDDAAAWVATSEQRWDDKPLVQFLLGQFAGKKEWLPGLAKGRGVVAGLSMADPPRLRLFVKTADTSTGEAIRAYFARRAAAAEQARHGGSGELAFFDAPIDPVSVFATLREMLTDAAKP